MRVTKKTNQKPMSNDAIYLIIVITLLSLATFTYIHEGLHALVAYAYGWEISDSSHGLMTGETSAIASSHASTLAYWSFFMLPALVMFLAVITITVLFPNRFVLVVGVIVSQLNLPSTNPQIPGSDAYNAAQFLMTRGWSETGAYTIHYILFFAILALYALFLYVVTENNQGDARRRMINIIR